MFDKPFIPLKSIFHDNGEGIAFTKRSILIYVHSAHNGTYCLDYVFLHCIANLEKKELNIMVPRSHKYLKWKLSEQTCSSNDLRTITAQIETSSIALGFKPLFTRQA